jgi:hypothetical protein
MKILSWNCRGLSRPSAVRSLRALIRENSPEILFLSETKSSPLKFLLSSIPLVSFSFAKLLLLAPKVALPSLGDLVLIWNVSSQTRITFQLGASLTPLIPHGFSLVYMAPLT